MQGEVEDGELIESDVEISSVPSQNGNETSKSTFWYDVPVSGGGCELGYMRTLNSKIMTSRRWPEGLPSSESENEGVLSDISDEEKPSKKRRFASNIQQNLDCTISYITDSHQLVHERGDSSNLRNRERKQQRNNIWASVVQDQILSSEMSGWSGLEQSVNSDRNVESYNYLKAKENNLFVSVPTFELEKPLSEIVPDISDIETFGTNSKSSKKPVLPKTSYKGNDQGAGRPWLKRNHHGRNQESVHNRLGSRGFDPNKDRCHIRVTSADEPSTVVQELLRILREPEGMKDTFGRVVETVGVEEALKFLYKTEDLEAAGGLMTLDGNRRRTPGGVYLYLVKTEVSKEQQNLIFQRQDLKQHKKKSKAERNRKLTARCQAMEVALGLDTKKDPTHSPTTATGQAKKPSSLKPDLEVMEEEEADRDVCLAYSDPSTSIELDFA